MSLSFSVPVAVPMPNFPESQHTRKRYKPSLFTSFLPHRLTVTCGAVPTSLQGRNVFGNVFLCQYSAESGTVKYRYLICAYARTLSNKHPDQQPPIIRQRHALILAASTKPRLFMVCATTMRLSNFRSMNARPQRPICSCSRCVLEANTRKKFVSASASCTGQR